MTVVPAYGRDYKSQKEVKQAWVNGDDFKDAISGRYLSSRDPVFDVWVRYDKATKIVQVK